MVYVSKKTNVDIEKWHLFFLPLNFVDSSIFINVNTDVNGFTVLITNMK